MYNRVGKVFWRHAYRAGVPKTTLDETIKRAAGLAPAEEHVRFGKLLRLAIQNESTENAADQEKLIQALNGAMTELFAPHAFFLITDENRQAVLEKAVEHRNQTEELIFGKGRNPLDFIFSDPLVIEYSAGGMATLLSSDPAALQKSEGKIRAALNVEGFTLIGAHQDDIKSIKGEAWENRERCGSIKKLVRGILIKAAKINANGVCIKETSADVMVLYRFDGYWRKELTLPKNLKHLIMLEISNLLGLKNDGIKEPKDCTKFLGTKEPIHLTGKITSTENGEEITIEIYTPSRTLLTALDLALYTGADTVQFESTAAQIGVCYRSKEKFRHAITLPKEWWQQVLAELNYHLNLKPFECKGAVEQSALLNTKRPVYLLGNQGATHDGEMVTVSVFDPQRVINEALGKALLEGADTVLIGVENLRFHISRIRGNTLWEESLPRGWEEIIMEYLPTVLNIKGDPTSQDEADSIHPKRSLRLPAEYRSDPGKTIVVQIFSPDQLIKAELEDAAKEGAHTIQIDIESDRLLATRFHTVTELSETRWPTYWGVPLIKHLTEMLDLTPSSSKTKKPWINIENPEGLIQCRGNLHPIVNGTRITLEIKPTKNGNESQ